MTSCRSCASCERELSAVRLELQAAVRERDQYRDALEHIARWFAVEMVGNEVVVTGFDPPAVFVDDVAAEMGRNPDLGWPDEEARGDLAELWPDCAALSRERKDTPDGPTR